MNVQQLVARYIAGAKTGHELVVDCLNLLDPGDPSSTLDKLPLESLPQLRKFVETYQPGKMRGSHGGAIPTPAQVSAARLWLAKQNRSISQKIQNLLRSGMEVKQKSRHLILMFKKAKWRKPGSPNLAPRSK